MTAHVQLIKHARLATTDSIHTVEVTNGTVGVSLKIESISVENKMLLLSLTPEESFELARALISKGLNASRGIHDTNRYAL